MLIRELRSLKICKGCELGSAYSFQIVSSKGVPMQGTKVLMRPEGEAEVTDRSL